MATGYLGVQSPFKRPNNSANVTYDNSGTQKLASGDSSVTITCGYLTDKSIVIITPVDGASGELPLIEAAYNAFGALQRVCGTNGKFIVSLQDGTSAAADYTFNWLVLNI
jgi:hypothetical protein